MMTKREKTSHALDKFIFKHTAKTVKALNVVRPTVMRGGIRL